MPRGTPLDYALKLLGYRARSEQELRQKLADKKYPSEEAEEALAKLTKIGLIDDRKLAENYVRDKLSISRRGPRRIYFELIKRGVAKEIAESATKGIDKEEELTTARLLLQSRHRQWANLDPLTKKSRAIGLLSRRGFSTSVIMQEITKYALT